MCYCFFVARRPKNPINDISNFVGGWLGGDGPTTNPIVSRAKGDIRTLASTADAYVGGGLGAAIVAEAKGDSGSVARQLAINAAAGGVAGGAVRGVTAAAVSPAGRAVARAAGNAAWKAKYTAKGMMPVPYSMVRQARQQSARVVQEMQQEVANVQDALFWATKAGDVRVERMHDKAARMANEFMYQYRTYNPVYERAQQRAVENAARFNQQAGATGRAGMEIGPREINAQLREAANDLFRESMGESSSPQNVNWLEMQLRSDVQRANAFQRAQGISRAADRRRINKPALSDDERMAARVRAEFLKERLEVQLLRSQMKRSNRR